MLHLKWCFMGFHTNLYSIKSIFIFFSSWFKWKNENNIFENSVFFLQKKLRFHTNLYINMILNICKGMGKIVQSILCSAIFSNVFLGRMVSNSNEMILNKDNNSFINLPIIGIELQFQVLLLTHLIEFCHWMVPQFI